MYNMATFIELTNVNTMIQLCLWVAMLAMWVIQVAGLGRNTWIAQSGAMIPEDEVTFGWLRSQDWWAVSLQLVVLICVLLSIFKLANKGYTVFLTTISILQLTFVADKYIAGTANGLPGSWSENLRTLLKTNNILTPKGDSVQAIVAGTIGELITNYIWLLFNAYFDVPATPAAAHH